MRIATPSSFGIQVVLTVRASGGGGLATSAADAKTGPLPRRLDLRELQNSTRRCNPMHAEVAFTGRLLDAGAHCPALQVAIQPPSNGQDRVMVAALLVPRPESVARRFTADDTLAVQGPSPVTHSAGRPERGWWVSAPPPTHPASGGVLTGRDHPPMGIHVTVQNTVLNASSSARAACAASFAHAGSRRQSQKGPACAL